MTQHDSPLIGVDGGGTGCRVAIMFADGTRQATGGPANASTDFEQAVRNVLTALTDAAQGRDLTHARAHIGLAGILSGDGAARFAARMPFGNCTVTGDRQTAVAGALGDADGYLIAAGTGSIVARQQSQTQTFVGGWGLQVSDHGSGGWLGRGLLEQVLLALDGITPQTELLRSISAAFNDDPRSIVTFAARATPADYAGFAPRLLANPQDPAAQMLLTHGAGHFTLALRALGFQPGDSLCLTGGIGPAYRDALAGLQARITAPQGSALDGALRLAARIERHRP